MAWIGNRTGSNSCSTMRIDPSTNSSRNSHVGETAMPQPVSTPSRTASELFVDSRPPTRTLIGPSLPSKLPFVPGCECSVDNAVVIQQVLGNLRLRPSREILRRGDGDAARRTDPPCDERCIRQVAYTDCNINTLLDEIREAVAHHQVHAQIGIAVEETPQSRRDMET